MRNRIKFAAILLWLPCMAASQFSITGLVAEDSTNQPLPGAHVILEGTFIATSTNSDGTFLMKYIKPGNYRLKATYIGYETSWKEVNLQDDLTVNFALHQSSIMSEEIVITAIRAAEKSPVTFINIPGKEIEKLNLGQDMPYLLESSPSVVTTSDAGTGIGYTGIRVRGSDQSRINVTVNGVPLNDSESQGVWWVDLPDIASSVDNIQIQRGVGTSTNGAAAFGASINIQTRQHSPDPYGEISGTLGSFNTRKITLRAGTGLIREKWAFDGRFSRIYSDGYIDRAFSDLTSYYLSGGYYGKKALVRITIFSGGEKTYQAWDGVPGYMLDTNRTYNGLGAYYDSAGQLKYYDNQTDNYLQSHYQIDWSQVISDSWNFSAAVHYTRGKGYYEEYKTGQEWAAYNLNDQITGNDTITSTDLVRQRWLDNHFYGLTLAVNFDNHKKLTATAGGAFNFYDGNHFGKIIWSRIALDFDKDYQWYESTAEKSDGNLFLKLNYQVIRKLNIYGDLQYRLISYRIDGIDNDLRDITQNHYYHFFNPKAGFYYDFDSRNRTFISFAVGNREPNRSALVDANPAKPYPVPESLYDLEGGYSYRHSRFAVDANLYYMHYRNQLVLTGKINDVGDPVMENVNVSYRAGIEFSLGIKFFKKLEWKVNATCSVNKIKNFTEYVDNWDEWPNQVINQLGTTDIAFSPAILGNSILTYEPVKNLQLSLYSKYVGKQYIDNTSSEERKLDPYFLNDLLVRYSVSPKFIKEISISLKINNLFNFKYETNAWVYRYYSSDEYGVYDGYFPQAGINFLVGLDLKF